MGEFLALPINEKISNRRVNRSNFYSLRNYAFVDDFLGDALLAKRQPCFFIHYMLGIKCFFNYYCIDIMPLWHYAKNSISNH